MCLQPGESERVSVCLSEEMKVVAHALDGTVATEFSLEVFNIGVVAETRNKEGLQWVTDDVGVFVRVD